MKTKLMALGLGIFDVPAIVMIRTDRVTTESDDFSNNLISLSAPAILFGLLCIWFASSLGDYIGPVPGIAGGYADETSPPLLFILFGWILLCIPFFLFLFIIIFLKTWS